MHLKVQSLIWASMLLEPIASVGHAHSGGRESPFEIWSMRSDGSDWIKLSDNAPLNATDPAWSPDGLQIVYGLLTQKADIFIMGIDGSDRPEVREVIVNPTINAPRGFAWSPDGAQIAFSANILEQSGRMTEDDILVVSTDASKMTNLTNSPSSSDWSPSWSPDGSKIVFVSGRSGNLDIYLMNIDGSEVHNLTNSLHHERSPCWSPDGNHIAYVSDQDGSNDVFVMGSNGSNPTNLTKCAGQDSYPHWSPDGTGIAFGSNRNGHWDIYLMDTHGSTLIRLTAESSDDYSPRWSPSGDQICFVSNREQEIFVRLPEWIRSALGN